MKDNTNVGSTNEGDYILDFVGPLGKPTEYEDNLNKVAVRGLGTAIDIPSKTTHNMGVDVDVIAGFRNKDLIILEKK